MAVISATSLQKDVKQAIAYGEQVRFRYFNYSGADAGYDDNVTLTQSGTDFYVSGLKLPIDATRGTRDAIEIEQGLIKQDDSKIYIDGTVNTSGMYRVGLGSPATGTEEYSVVENGVIVWDIGGQEVYKKLYIRALPTGSLLGE